jgi:methylase of polypeptide subunit release factors
MSSNNIYGLRTNGNGHGDVPTSPEVVRYMLDLVGYVSCRNLSDVKILEPSCGDGVFIIEIANRLKESSQVFGFNAQNAFENCVYGCEIVVEKISHCKQRLEALGFDTASSQIKIGDFLQSRLPEMDIVVGNPPYVRYENIPAIQLDFIKKTFPTFHYRADLYIPFFEKSLRLLKPNGQHCFICANRWLKNEYGKKLRRLVATCFRLEKMINLEHADAFQENVLAYPAITLIANGRSASSFEYAEIEKVSELTALKMESREMPVSDDWTIAFNRTVNSDHLYTIEELGFKIGIGVATGADGVFISSKLPDIVEHELLLPALNAKDLRGDHLKWHGEYLLNPYSSNGELINLSRYPLAAKYLDSHHDRLSKRHVAQKNPSKWYKTIDRISPHLKSEAKILLPDMSGNKYVFVDEGNYYPLHNLYYITGHSVKELKILSAILMSNNIRQQIGNITNNMNGGFPRWQSQYLRKLKLPNIGLLEKAFSDQLIISYDIRDYDQINTLVGQLYYDQQNVSNHGKLDNIHDLLQKRQKQEQELALDFAV